MNVLVYIYIYCIHIYIYMKVSNVFKWKNDERPQVKTNRYSTNVSFTVKASFSQGLCRLPSFTFPLLISPASNAKLLAVRSLESIYHISNISWHIVPHVPQRFLVSLCLTLCDHDPLVQSSQNRYKVLRSSRRKRCHHLHNLSYQTGKQNAPTLYKENSFNYIIINYILDIIKYKCWIYIYKWPL